MAYIFLFEVIVDDLHLFSDVRNSSPEAAQDDSGTVRRELCVRLQLSNLVRCEVCEKDFGSALDMEVRKTGENCLFAYNPTLELQEELELRISAHEKGPDGVKRLVGSWKEPAREMLVGLAQGYDLQNGMMPQEDNSQESMLSSVVEQTQRNKPVSNTFKASYPLEVETGNVVVGVVILTIRVSCLGPNINQKVLFGGRDVQQQPVTCYKMENEPVVQCVTLEDQDDQVLVAPKASLASIVGTEIVPEVQPYDEYAAELNGNAICIRVEKDANIAVSIDGEDSSDCTKGCWTSLTLPDGVYGLKEEYIRHEANGCKLPIIRGTLKYPAYHWSGDFMVAKKTTPVTVEDYRKKPEPTRTVGLQALPEHVERDCAGIEICRKGWHDPNVDVFVLKLGKNKRTSAEGNPRNEVEIELRTPRGPSQEIRPKVSRGMQVLEEEFEPAGEMNRPAAAIPAGDGDKAGKGKGKAAGKKGKKK
ncbi:uncharacterized protein LOC118504730 isoform X1 [Anopheles stephensi]|uniref:uncharacterized protein LOC118504730 isoform X1 n=1 Tax=Anopheles stephensi TaxID=30069 RepID=UPI001658ACAA|nr:uncharacterized protein LOC118504730 isoform X1 [Anopheles stephensi]